MNILFTIAGRAGSKGLKNKNLKEMNGVPLVYYTLATISLFREKHAEDNIDISVNTDSTDLIDIIEKQPTEKYVHFITRKESLAGDKAPKVEVIKDTFLETEKETGKKYDCVVDLDITSPMRRVSDVENAVSELMKNPAFALTFSVVPSRRSPYFNMVEKKEDGFYKKVCKSAFTARQQAPEVFELNASIYAYSPKFLGSEIDKTILDYNCGIVTMPDFLVLDIDSEEDFKMMERLMPYFIETDEGLKAVFEKAKIL